MVDGLLNDICPGSAKIIKLCPLVVGNPLSTINPKDHSLFGFGLPGYTRYPKHRLKIGCGSRMTPNNSNLARWCFHFFGLTTPPKKCGEKRIQLD